MLPDSPHSIATDDPHAGHVARQVEKFRKQLLDRPSKTAIYKDLDPEIWPGGRGPTQHVNIRALCCTSRIEKSTRARKFLQPLSLIYDTNSSQHSAIVDVLSGKELTIYRPSGTGKSQTIANLITAAAMTGKTVLFVAEKSTALDVVHDRLDKAGLSPFCFNLHTQRIRSGAVQDQLDRRVNMPEPDFSRSQYDRQKSDCQKQRQGLKVYARIMETRVGRLDYTVHDILCRKINMREFENYFPDGKTRLSDIEAVTMAEIAEARDCIGKLKHAKTQVDATRSADGPMPWRGLGRGDLAPPDIAPILYRIENWKQSLVALDRRMRKHGFPVESMAIGEISAILRGALLIRRFPDSTKHYDLASLASQHMRDRVARAAARRRQLLRLSNEITQRHGVGGGQLVKNDGFEYRSTLQKLLIESSELGVSSLTSKDMRILALKLRRDLDRGTRVDETLTRTRTGSNIDNVDGSYVDAAETIEKAIEILNDTEADFLSLRVDTPIAHDARRLLDHARNKIENLRRLRDSLPSCFYLGDLPSPSELRRHASVLYALRGPWLLSRSARAAVRRYRQLASKKRDKASAVEKAGDFCNLAEYIEALSQLNDDSGINECLCRFWGGKAYRLDRLAESIETAGLSETYTISQAEDLIKLADKHRSLVERAKSDENLDGIFSLQRKLNFESLESLQSLCDAMSSLDLDDEIWRNIAGFCAQARSIGNICSEMQSVIERERKARSELAEALCLIEIEFLDGKFCDAAPVPDLRKRAEECLAAGAALLPSSAFRHARENVKRSHAAPVLAVVEEQGAPLARLDSAYESALYRSLSTFIYGRHPELRGLSGRQLRNHRNAFHDLESRLRELERARIVHVLRSRPVTAYSEMALLRYCLALQHSGLTPRELIHRASVALRQLKPCFMMSPTTVAELLPRHNALFDIVVIDEASHMLPSDALGAIARGRQTVVVGDPAHPPPSTYFRGRVALTESILDLSLSACRRLYLLDHCVVEVEDTVLYRRVKGDTSVRRVTIVRGADDVANGIVSDYKPLATALLGATVGKTVTVRQPTTQVDIVVVRIDRPESETDFNVMRAENGVPVHDI